MVLVTKQGLVKRTPLSAYRDMTSRGKIAIRLNEGDAVGWAALCTLGDSLVVATAKGMLLKYDVDAVREAVSAGLSLDARDGLGRTPLVVAVVHGRKRCVDVLLDGGADPETPSGHRSRPLAYAAFRGDAALCARLLGAGADPNKKAADGWTALHVAARA